MTGRDKYSQTAKNLGKTIAYKSEVNVVGSMHTKDSSPNNTNDRRELITTTNRFYVTVTTEMVPRVPCQTGKKSYLSSISKSEYDYTYFVHLVYPTKKSLAPSYLFKSRRNKSTNNIFLLPSLFPAVCLKSTQEINVFNLSSGQYEKSTDTIHSRHFRWVRAYHVVKKMQHFELQA